MRIQYMSVVTVLLLALAACHGAEWRRDHPRLCPIHHVVMPFARVRYGGGLPRRFSDDYLAARREFFPFALRFVHAGDCFVHWRKHKTIRTCPRCLQAEAEWLAAHDYMLFDHQTKPAKPEWLLIEPQWLWTPEGENPHTGSTRMR